MLDAPLIAVIPGIDAASDLWEPLTHLPWSSWSAFWLGDTLYGRNAVVIFLLLIPALLFAPRRYLRHTIILTGLLFVGYVFGVAYLAFWLFSCLGFYRLSEQFAIEAKRTDVIPWGPPLAAVSIVCGYFLAVHLLDDVNLPKAANAWLQTHTPWLYPLGYRGVSWEPDWRGTERQFLHIILYRSHDIGTAYLVMRMVHYFSEIKRDSIPKEQRTCLNFLAYLCYAPTLIQGPIERFKEFNEQIDTCRDRWSWRDPAVGILRMGLGVAKVVFLLSFMVPWMNDAGFVDPKLVTNPDQVANYAILFLAIHLAVFGLYLVFSAYCDLAIGMSRLLGYRVVENFRYFWMARSLTDMWRRWHISLSFILRDYIFFPLTRRRWNGTLVAIITFLVCGVWHSLSLNYILWGILMGLLVAVNQKWSRWMRTLDRHPQRKIAAVRRSWLKLRPLPTVCAWLLTINAFMMTGWVCFFGFAGFRVIWEIIWRPVRALTTGGG